MRKILLTSVVWLAMTGSALSQCIYLSLDSCISMAIRNNKELSVAQMKEEVATLHRKEAFTNYLPKIDAMGGYVRNEKEISLLSDEQKTGLQNLGNAMGQTLTPMLQNAAAQNPAMAPVFQQLGLLGQQMAPVLNGMGEQLVDALRTDSRNMTAASIMLTQPLFMGGKIVAYNNITRYAEQIAHAQRNQKTQELVLNVETAYWQIVDLEQKRTLAISYKQLIDTLDYNVEQLIAEGMASKADGLSVKVKKNEAEVTLIQIDNGLALSKMLLCQLCGLSVGTDVHPTTDISEITPALQAESISFSQRPELNSLELLSKIGREKVKVARAEHLPTVALTANYLWSNPNVYNGFERKMDGMWNVGVMVKVPLISWGEGYYKVKAAKTEARIAETTYEETREKIELQATQCYQRVIEATNREETAKRSVASAEENLRFANEGMKEGVIPISNVIMAQTAWLSAQSTLISARIDIRLAQVNLKRACGTLY